MKKNVFNLAAFSCIALTALSSCGSIGSLITHGKRPVYMMQAPADLEVTQDGKKLEFHKYLFATTEHESSATNTRTTVSYYAKSVRLPYKSTKTLELYSPSQNKKATIEVKSKGSGAIIIGDLLFTGPVGIIIDVATKNHKVFKPKYIDVQAALDHKEWHSQHKLKRMAKKKAK